MQLAELNAIDEDDAVRELLRCCGSTRWARAMAVARPFASAAALEQAADTIWRTLGRADVLEAFAAHPKIGDSGQTQPSGQAGPAGLADRPTAAGEAGLARQSGSAGTGPLAWSKEEQSGMGAASDDVRARLAAGNRAYEARFGYIFIICATGRSAGEMLAALEARLHHTPDEELPVAAEEQRRITRLRLARLVDAPHT
jgi:OHCU decarboxylase